MSLITNKDDFRHMPEVWHILDKLELAHKLQDELMASILLTKLSQLNFKIAVDKTVQ